MSWDTELYLPMEAQGNTMPGDGGSPSIAAHKANAGRFWILSSSRFDTRWTTRLFLASEEA
jgi:hypothetical protein